MSAEIIDYTAEALHRRTLDKMNRGDWEEASMLSALTEGYLDGLWSVSWEGGEPKFSVTEHGKKFNDYNELDDEEQMHFGFYEDSDEAPDWASDEGPLDEQ